MTRDIWLDDDEPGCLECGVLVFKASHVSGVCQDCMSEVASSLSVFRDEFEYFSGEEDDIPWTEH